MDYRAFAVDNARREFGKEHETYICSECRGVFAFTRTDTEAHAEAVETFGRDGHAPDMAIVCDDCYRQIMGRAHTHPSPRVEAFLADFAHWVARCAKSGDR